MPSFGLPVRRSAPSLLLVLIWCALCRLSGSTAAVADPHITVCQHRIEGQSLMYGQQQTVSSVFLDQARVAAGTKAGRLRKLNTYYSPEGCVTGVKPVYASGAAVSQLVGVQHGMREKSLELSANETVNRADISYDSRCIRYIRWYTNSSRNATVGSQHPSTTSKLAVATPAKPLQQLMAFKGRLDSSGALAQMQLIWGEAVCKDFPASVAAPAQLAGPSDAAALPADVPLEPTPAPAMATQPSPPSPAKVQQLTAVPSGKEQQLTSPSVQSHSMTVVQPAAVNTTAVPKQTATANVQGPPQAAAATVGDAKALAALLPAVTAAAVTVDPHKRSANVTQQADAMHVGLNGSSTSAAAVQHTSSKAIGSSAPARAAPADNVKLSAQSAHPATNATDPKQSLSASLSSAGGSLLNLFSEIVNTASAASSQGSVPVPTSSSRMRVAANALQSNATRTAAAAQSTSSVPAGSSAPASVTSADSVKLNHPATGHKQALGTSASPAFSSFLAKSTGTTSAASSEGRFPISAASNGMRVVAGPSQSSTPAQVLKRPDPLRSALSAIGGFAEKLFGRARKSDAQAPDSSKTRFQSVFADEDDDSFAERRGSKAGSWPVGTNPDLGNTQHQSSVTAASRGKGKALDSRTGARLQQQQQSPFSQLQQQQQQRSSVTVAFRNGALDSSRQEGPPPPQQQQQQSPVRHSQQGQTNQQQWHTRYHRRQRQQQADTPDHIINMQQRALPGNRSHTAVAAAAAAATATNAAGNHGTHGNHGNRPSKSSDSRFNSTISSSKHSSGNIDPLIEQPNESVDRQRSQRPAAQQLPAAQPMAALHHNRSKAKIAVPVLTSGSHSALPPADSTGLTGNPSLLGANAAAQSQAYHSDAQQDSHLQGNIAPVDADDRQPAVVQQNFLTPMSSKSTAPTAANDATAATERLAPDRAGFAAPRDYTQNPAATDVAGATRSTPDKRSQSTAFIRVGLSITNNTPVSSFTLLDQEVKAVPAGPKNVAVLNYIGPGNSTDGVSTAETHTSESLKLTAGNNTSIGVLEPSGGNTTQGIQVHTTANMSVTRDITNNNTSPAAMDSPQVTGATAGVSAALRAAQTLTAQQGGNLSSAAPLKMPAAPAAESKANIEPLAVAAQQLNATQSGLTGAATVDTPAASTVLTSVQNNSTTATGTAAATALSTSGLKAGAPVLASGNSDSQLMRDWLQLETLTQNSTDGAAQDDVQVEPITPPAATDTAAADRLDTAGTAVMLLPRTTAIAAAASPPTAAAAAEHIEPAIASAAAISQSAMTAAAAPVAPRNRTAATHAVLSAARFPDNLTITAAAQSRAPAAAMPANLTSAANEVPSTAAQEPGVIVSQSLNAPEAPTAAASSPAPAALPAPADNQTSPAAAAAALPALAAGTATPAVAAVAVPAPAANGSSPAVAAAAVLAPAAKGSSPAVDAVAVPALATTGSSPAVDAATVPAPAANGSSTAVDAEAVPAPAVGTTTPAVAAMAVPALAANRSSPAVDAAAVPALGANRTSPAVDAAAVPALAATISSSAAASAALPAPADNKTLLAAAAAAVPASGMGIPLPAVAAAAVPAPAVERTTPPVAAAAAPAPAASVSSPALAAGTGPASEDALPAEAPAAGTARTGTSATTASALQQGTSPELISTAQEPVTQTSTPSVGEDTLAASNDAPRLPLAELDVSGSAAPGMEHTAPFAPAPGGEEPPTSSTLATGYAAAAATALPGSVRNTAAMGPDVPALLAPLPPTVAAPTAQPASDSAATSADASPAEPAPAAVAKPAPATAAAETAPPATANAAPPAVADLTISAAGEPAPAAAAKPALAGVVALMPSAVAEPAPPPAVANPMPSAVREPAPPPAVANLKPSTAAEPGAPPAVANLTPSAAAEPAAPPAVANVTPSAVAEPAAPPAVANVTPSAVAEPAAPPAVANVTPSAVAEPAAPPAVANVTPSAVAEPAAPPAAAIVANLTPSAVAEPAAPTAAPTAAPPAATAAAAAKPAPAAAVEPTPSTTSGPAPSWTPPEPLVSVGDGSDTLAWRLFDDLLQDASSQDTAEGPMPAASVNQPIVTAADLTATRQLGLTHSGGRRPDTQQQAAVSSQSGVRMFDNGTASKSSQHQQHHHHHHHQQQQQQIQKADNTITAATAESLPSADATQPVNQTTAATVLSTAAHRQDSTLQQPHGHLQQQLRTHRQQMQSVQGPHNSSSATLPAASGLNLTGNLTMALPGRNHSQQLQQHELHSHAKSQQLQQDKNITLEPQQPATTSQNATSRNDSDKPAATRPADSQQQQQQQRPLEQLQQLWAKWQQHHNASNSTGVLAQLPASTVGVSADTNPVPVQAVLQPDNVTFDAHTQASEPDLLNNQSQASHLRAGPPPAPTVADATAVPVAAPPMAMLTLPTPAAEALPAAAEAAATGTANTTRAPASSKRLASPQCRARPAMCDASITSPSDPAYCPVAAPFTTPQCVGGCCVSAGKCSSSDCAASGLGQGLPHMMCQGIGSYGSFGYDPSGDTVCRHLACRLAVPGCVTGAAGGNCIGKLVAVSTADQLHPEGLRLLGSPCLEAMPGDVPLNLDGTSSQHGEFIARLWSVCNCQADDGASAATSSNTAAMQPGKNSNMSDIDRLSIDNNHVVQKMLAVLHGTASNETSNIGTNKALGGAALTAGSSAAAVSGTSGLTQQSAVTSPPSVLEPSSPGSMKAPMLTTTSLPYSQNGGSAANDTPGISRAGTPLQGTPAWLQLLGLASSTAPGPAAAAYEQQQPGSVAAAAPGQAEDAPPAKLNQEGLPNMRLPNPAATSHLHSSPTAPAGGAQAASGPNVSNTDQPLGGLADVLLGIGRFAAAALGQGNGSSTGSSAAVPSNSRLTPGIVAAGTPAAPAVAPSIGLGQLAAAALAALQNSTAKAGARNRTAGSTSRSRSNNSSLLMSTTAGSGSAPSPATADDVEEDYDDGVIRSGRYKGYISSRGAVFSHSSSNASSPEGTNSSSSSSSNSSGGSTNSSAAVHQHSGASPEASPASLPADGNRSTAGAGLTGIRSTAGELQLEPAQVRTVHHGGHDNIPAANASAASHPSETALPTSSGPHWSSDNHSGATGVITAHPMGLLAMVNPKADMADREDGLLGGLTTGLADARTVLPEGNSSSRMPALQGRWQAADTAPGNISNITKVSKDFSSSDNRSMIGATDDSPDTASPIANIALGIPDDSSSKNSSNSAALGNQQQEQAPLAPFQEGGGEATWVKDADKTNTRAQPEQTVVQTGSASANRRLLIIRKGSKLVQKR